MSLYERTSSGLVSHSLLGQKVVAALYVETDGCYFRHSNIQCWDEQCDARKYAGPHPVVAHPPCQRWGRMATGGPSAPGTRILGDDSGCFAAALDAVRRWGGVLEHPCDSRAWSHYGMDKPKRHAGWSGPDIFGGRSCYVEQGHYGHMSRKPTWLYACHTDFPQLNWNKGEQRIHPVALAKHGYEKARRIGMTAMIGGKDKTKMRNATPIDFRDVLLSIARSSRK
jgi:hypothetical protein